MLNAQDVIDFWFHQIEPSQWWIKDENFDQLIKTKFIDIHTAASCCELYQWRKTSLGRLAEIIVLDQFSRNIYRDSPKAFSNDPLALALAQEAVSLKVDKQLIPIQNSFLYMPFMHSESLAIHDNAIELFRKSGINSNLEFEIKHRDIIREFGRYPHRNIILGRASTNKELEFLTLPNSSF